jgi:hypothetical protein
MGISKISKTHVFGLYVDLIGYIYSCVPSFFVRPELVEG